MSLFPEAQDWRGSIDVVLQDTRVLHYAKRRQKEMECSNFSVGIDRKSTREMP